MSKYVKFGAILTPRENVETFKKNVIKIVNVFNHLLWFASHILWASHAWALNFICHAPLCRQFPELPLLPWPFIFYPVTYFFLFMEHLYLDVLPSPKSKHGEEKGYCDLSLAHLFCFPCTMVSEADKTPRASPPHSNYDQV